MKKHSLCPLCGGEPKRFESPFQSELYAYGCPKCEFTTFWGVRLHWLAWEALVSKFPPIMRVQIGERVKVDSYGETLFTIESKDIKNFKLYFKETDIDFPDCCCAEDISEWPWELDGKEVE